MTQASPAPRGSFRSAAGSASSGAHGNGPQHRSRARGCKARKRATFPFINSQIISIADMGDLPLLLSTIQVYVEEMNLVNISTALHRLARLTSGDPRGQAQLQKGSVLQELVARAGAMLAKAMAGISQPNCQALSNITWALATIQFVDMSLLQALAELSEGRVADFKPFELSAALWGFATLGGLDAGAVRSAGGFFDAAAAHIPGYVGQFTFRCLVMITWAFAAAGRRDERVFAVIAEEMLVGVKGANCQEISNAAWAFGTAGIRHERLLGALAFKGLHHLADFRRQELASLLWGLASAGCPHEELFLAAALSPHLLDLQESQQAAGSLWALSQGLPKHQVTQAAVLRLLSRCTWTLHSLEPEDLAMVAIGAARCFSKDGGAHGGSEEQPVEVTEFFAAALAWVKPRLALFTPEYLSQVAWALAALHLGGSEEYQWLLAAAGAPAGPRSGGCRSNAYANDGSGHKGEVLVPAVVPAWPTRHRPAGGVGSGGGGSAVAPQTSERQQAAAAAASHPQRAATGGATNLGPPLDFLPRFACMKSMEELEVFRAGYQRFRTGNASGAKTKASSSSDEPGGALGLARRLPPPLDIIPQDISPEKLEAFRIDYQRFRAGEAVGAKGEVSTACCAKRDEPSFISLDNLEAIGEDFRNRAAGRRSSARASSAAPGMGAPVGEGGGPAQPPVPPWEDAAVPQLVVKNTFLHFAEADPADAEGADGAEGQAPKLQPALPIIPHSVSAEKLEAYRLDYHKFRRGGALGAKGEVFSSVDGGP